MADKDTLVVTCTDHIFLMCLSLMFTSMFLVQLSMWILFLFLHFLWATFRSLSYSNLLDLVGLSIHFYMLHSSPLMLSYIRHPTILSCLVFVGFLSFVLLLLLLLFFICFHSSSTWISSSTARSFPSFSNSSFICCWNFVDVLGSRSFSTWNFFYISIQFMFAVW
jgi:hypothetical protein